jgi:putative membrane protein
MDDSTESQEESESEIESAVEFDPDEFDHMTTQTLVSRSAFGGFLMGLANLVPGISGGTMLLAAGIYPRFIEAIADVTRFRFGSRSLLVLACAVGSAGIGILLFAGVVKNLVVDQRWMMYSIFIGLTLGGLPVVWKLAKPASLTLIVAAIVAFAGMTVLAALQMMGVVGSGSSNPALLFAAGLAGASAMILPGISGGYLLLLMGQYVPILSAIDEFKSALAARDVAAAMGPALSVVLPVGLGVVTGVVVVGNLLKWCLHHYRQATLGVLIGLMLGSIVGLWPFQQSVPPSVGDTIKGQVVTAETLAEIEPDDWATEYFRPALGQVAGAVGFTAIGFALTMGIARIGSDE